MSKLVEKKAKDSSRLDVIPIPALKEDVRYDAKVGILYEDIFQVPPTAEEYQNCAVEEHEKRLAASNEANGSTNEEIAKATLEYLLGHFGPQKLKMTNVRKLESSKLGKRKKIDYLKASEKATWSVTSPVKSAKQGAFIGVKHLGATVKAKNSDADVGAKLLEYHNNIFKQVEKSTKQYYVMAQYYRNQYTNIVPRLYLGKYPVTYGYIMHMGVRLGVTLVINLLRDFENQIDNYARRREYLKYGIVEMSVPTYDSTEPALEQMEAAVSAIVLCLQKDGCVVYVHCRKGRGRSTAVVFEALQVLSSGIADTAPPSFIVQAILDRIRPDVRGGMFNQPMIKHMNDVNSAENPTGKVTKAKMVHFGLGLVTGLTVLIPHLMGTVNKIGSRLKASWQSRKLDGAKMIVAGAGGFIGSEFVKHEYVPKPTQYVRGQHFGCGPYPEFYSQFLTKTKGIYSHGLKVMKKSKKKDLDTFKNSPAQNLLLKLETVAGSLDAYTRHVHLYFLYLLLKFRDSAEEDHHADKAQHHSQEQGKIEILYRTKKNQKVIDADKSEFGKFDLYDYFTEPDQKKLHQLVENISLTKEQSDAMVKNILANDGGGPNVQDEAVVEMEDMHNGKDHEDLNAQIR